MRPDEKLTALVAWLFATLAPLFGLELNALTVYGFYWNTERINLVAGPEPRSTQSPPDVLVFGLATLLIPTLISTRRKRRVADLVWWHVNYERRARALDQDAASLKVFIGRLASLTTLRAQQAKSGRIADLEAWMPTLADECLETAQVLAVLDPERAHRSW